MKLAPAAVLLAAAAVVPAGCASSHPTEQAARAHRQASHRPPLISKKVVACERSGKLICDPVAYRRDRREGLLPLSTPDPKGAHLLTLRQVLPPAWRGKDYGAQLMTYGRARRIAPGLAGATRVAVDPSRKFWVLTLYHRPPVTVPMTWGPPGGPATIKVRTESQDVDAVTGESPDQCVNCAAVPAGVVSTRPVPAWVAKCLPKGSALLGPAPRYIGLTPGAANRLNGGVVYAGGGGKCFTFDDDVYRPRPIAVVISTRLVRTPGSRIVAAARAVAGWQPGPRAR
jgi:hypothetical protein